MAKAKESEIDPNEEAEKEFPAPKVRKVA
jgi:hypothetical protein